MGETTRTNIDPADADSLDLEDLFATEETASVVEEPAEDSESTRGTDADVPADTTAGELFDELREEHEGADEEATAELDDESPEDIMARADEATVHVDQIHDAIRADEDALSDLLLTGRRKADGFLWVDTEDEVDRVGEVTENGTEDLGSLFAPDTGSTSEGNSDAASPSQTETDGSDAAAETDGASGEGGDEFSLGGGADESFEARAATFEDATDAFSEPETVEETKPVDEEAQVHESETVDEEGPVSEVDAEPVGVDDDTVEDFPPADSQSSSTTGEDSSAKSDGSATQDDESSSDAGGDESLASRIRSILSG